MSSILKALKRLERDKARRQEDNVDLARDILHGDGRRLGPPAWLLPLLILLGVLLAATLLVLIWPREVEPPVVVTPPTPQGAVAPAAVRVEPVVVEEIIDRRRPATAATPPAALPATSQPAAVVPPAAVPPAPRPVADPPAATVATAPLAAEPAADAALAISAIAYSDDPAARLAVVNELPVMEGTVIGEVRVEEIRADRVIFSRDGVRFTLTFDVAEP